MQDNLTQSAADSPRAETDRFLRHDPRLKVAAKLKPNPLGIKRCPQCGSLNLMESEARGPHHLQLTCGDCGRFLGFLRASHELRRARRRLLDFGCFAGSTLGALSKSARGLSYLRWLASKDFGDLGKAAELVLRACHR
jgi:hypothetical protein